MSTPQKPANLQPRIPPLRRWTGSLVGRRWPAASACPWAFSQPFSISSNFGGIHPNQPQWPGAWRLCCQACGCAPMPRATSKRIANSPSPALTHILGTRFIWAPCSWPPVLRWPCSVGRLLLSLQSDSPSSIFRSLLLRSVFCVPHFLHLTHIAGACPDRFPEFSRLSSSFGRFGLGHRRKYRGGFRSFSFELYRRHREYNAAIGAALLYLSLLFLRPAIEAILHGAQ